MAELDLVIRRMFDKETSDEHGSPYPHGFAGMGVMGMGAGHLIFTLTKPIPVERV